MDATQRITDFVVLVMLAAGLAGGVAQMRVDAVPEGSSSEAATTAACALEAVESDGDMSDEWIDPFEDGNGWNPH